MKNWEICGKSWDENEYPAGTRQRVYARAFEFYGTEHQMIVAIEEMSELTKEICKLLRDGTTMDNLVDELADVEIMLEQLKMMFDAEDAVRHRKDEKALRLAERIEAELEEMENE